MKLSVAGNKIFGIMADILVINACNFSASFPNQQKACCNVPGVCTKGYMRIKVAVCNRCLVYNSTACNPYLKCFSCQLAEDICFPVAFLMEIAVIVYIGISKASV